MRGTMIAFSTIGYILLAGMGRKHGCQLLRSTSYPHLRRKSAWMDFRDFKGFPGKRKAIDIGDYYANFDKVSADFHWTPQVGLKEGLSRTFDYYRRHIEHYL